MARRGILCAFVLGISFDCAVHVAFAQDRASALKKVTVRDEVELHYLERGQGTPLIFVHGTMGDYSIWLGQIDAFAEDYRAISYSRRYNYPNSNKLQPRHSAAVEAEDLAAFIRKLKLPKVHLVGYSYGGYTALLLALKEPELVRTLTLAEPPILVWLADLPGESAEEGRVARREFMDNCVRPSRAAFAKGEHENGVRYFLDGVGGKGTFDKLPAPVRERCMRNVLELEALMTSDAMYPVVDRKRVGRIEVPTLMLSGGDSPAIGKLTDAELERLLPATLRTRVVLPGATHLMWAQRPEECRRALNKFLSDK